MRDTTTVPTLPLTQSSTAGTTPVIADSILKANCSWSAGRRLIIVGGENIYPQDIEEIVASHLAIHDGRVVAMGLYNPELGTDDIVVVAEVEREELLAGSAQIEQELRNLVVSGIAIAVRTIFLKPPRWIVKSTAGKASRSATRVKLLRNKSSLGRLPDGDLTDSSGQHCATEDSLIARFGVSRIPPSGGLFRIL